MVKMPLRTLIIIIFLILLSSNVYAISLGSLVKDKTGEVSKDESIKFKMLFWNVENEAYDVELSVKEAPKDWIVIISPAEFILNKSIGEEYVSLPYSENVKAKVVNLYVKPDKYSEPGKYFVVIGAETRLENEVNGMNVVPERLFKFEVNVEGLIAAKNDTNKISLSENEIKTESKDLVAGNIEVKPDKKYFYSVIVLLVMTISIILYKKSR
jgi:hypothetical protein